MRTTTALMLALGVASMVAADPGMGQLTVAAHGFESEKGTVLIQLANSAADYDDDAGAFRHAEVKAASGRASVVFENVPFGEYAVKIFHDENDNKKIDMGWRGPTERYGFSNDARGLMGPPSYDDAKFTLAAEKHRVEIRVK